MLKLQLNGKKVMGIKYYKLKIAVCSMVLWSDVYRGFVVHCTNDTFTHQSKPQTLYTHHSTEPHSGQLILTYNILYPSLFYHLTVILTKAIRL